MAELFKIIGCIGLLSIVSCRIKSDPDLSRYYIFKDLGSEMQLFEFKSEKDTMLANEYYYQSIKMDSNNKVIKTVFLNNYLRTQQFRTDIIHEDGITLSQLQIQKDPEDPNAGRTTVQIITNNVFPFFPPDSQSVYIFHIHWPQTDSLSYRIIKNRRFVSMEGNRAKFEVKELIQQDILGQGNFEKTFVSLEWYAKDSGLVKYQKEIGPGLNREYVLEKIYNVETTKEFKMYNLHVLE